MKYRIEIEQHPTNGLYRIAMYVPETATEPCEVSDYMYSDPDALEDEVLDIIKGVVQARRPKP